MVFIPGLAPGRMVGDLTSQDILRGVVFVQIDNFPYSPTLVPNAQKKGGGLKFISQV